MSRPNRALPGELIIAAGHDSDLSVGQSFTGKGLRVRVTNRVEYTSTYFTQSTSVYLSPADEAALLAYLQERAGEQS